MKYRIGKLNNFTLFFLLFITILLYGIVEFSRKPQRELYFQSKLKAAHLMSLSENIIKEKNLVNIDITNDPNETGLIGSQFSLITSSGGDIDAKLTTTNPNFAAVIVEMLKKLKVKKGDLIGIGMTGSFPAINIACLSAIEILQLDTIIISSVSSSMWGANNPDFTWLDMETLLKQKKIFTHSSDFASIGGGEDIGRGLSIEGRELIIQAIKRNKINFINEQNLEDSIDRRMKIYEEFSTKKGKKIKVFINIGGGMANVGNDLMANVLLPNGIIKNKDLKSINFPIRTVVVKMLEKNIPVIHFLNIKKIAHQYKLPIAPCPQPPIGEGELFFKEKYSVSTTIICLILLLIFLFIFIRLDIKHYIFKNRFLKKNF